jgi:Zn finger protein HypA/HybF involved in hydrogenase expression
MKSRENIRIVSNTNSGFNQIGFESKRESKENKDLKQKIDLIYSSEFKEGIGSIMTESESVFLNKTLSKIKLILFETVPKAHLEERNIKEYILQLDEKLFDRYYNTKKFFLKVFNEFKKNPKLFEVLSKFRKHCNKCSDTPIHNCKSSLFLVKENNEIKYVFCSGCKEVFLANSIILNCSSCQIDYYSSIVGSTEEMIYQPATWENYHCGSLKNQQMHCLKCKEKLYIRLTDNYLFCSNCKFSSDPNKIIWICGSCKSEFQSQAKIYNPIEFNIIKNIIKEALLNKISAFPTYNKCCVKEKNAIFFHKSSCKGELFLSEMKKKPILVCSKCKSIISLQGFSWTCPKCNNVFLDEDKKVQRSQVSTSETAKDSECLSPLSMNKSNTAMNLEDERSLYIKKSIQMNSNINLYSKDKNLNNVDTLLEEKGKPRNNSVYKYTKNTKSENKETSVIQISEEFNDDNQNSKSRFSKFFQNNEAQDSIKMMNKEYINNINVNISANIPSRMKMNDLENHKKPIIHSKTTCESEGLNQKMKQSNN